MAEEFLVRSNDVATSFGEYPGKRSVEQLLKCGLLVLDKWPGPTSHDVAATVKKIFGLGKVGHSGTLDPAVSGVLPITLENACKVIPALQGLGKAYVGIMRLHKDVSDKDLNVAVSKFIGTIRQKPPVRSAVTRRVREREVYDFKILERDGRDVLFHITCQAGTYVRVICHDIGKLVGGANMAELRRTDVGRFNEQVAVKVQDVADAYHYYKENGSEQIRDYVLPVEFAVEHLGKIIVKDSAVHSIASGTPVYSTGVSKVSKGVTTGDLVAVLTLKGELAALARAVMDAADAVKKKGLAAKTDRVIIDKNLYPKLSSG
jgi:H/ACA ribonucleoprotein complex subunit 4